MIEGDGIVDAAVDHHAPIDLHRHEDGGNGAGGGNGRAQRAALEDGLMHAVIIGGGDLQRDGEAGEILGNGIRQEGFQNALDVELAEAEAVGHGLAECRRPQAPEPVEDLAAPADGRQRIVADLAARHARRHARTHDGADGGAGNRHRPDAQFIQHLDDMQMRQPARPAAAEGNRHRRA